MPNHVSNIIKVTSGDFKAVKEFFCPEGHPDFNTLVPMPEELRNTRSPAIIVADHEFPEAKAKAEAEYREHCKKYPEFEKDHNPDYPLSVSENKKLIEKYGTNNWYDWSVSHWGTKWNAYDPYVEDDAIHFSTAWSPPSPIFHALSEKFPDCVFNIEWEEEQGYGQILNVENGESEVIHEWDIPTIEEVDEDNEIYEVLDENHFKLEKGFYCGWPTDGVGPYNSLEEAIEATKVS